MLLGVVGYIGIFDAEGPAFWLDNGENVAHTVPGIVARAATYVPGLNKALEPLYRPIVIVVGVVALFFGIYGFLVAGNSSPNTFGAANLENPLDNLLHLVVGVWALYASFRPIPKMMGA